MVSQGYIAAFFGNGVPEPFSLTFERVAASMGNRNAFINKLIASSGDFDFLTLNAEHSWEREWKQWLYEARTCIQ